MKKKLLSLLLAFVMVIGMLPATALAADDPDDTVWVTQGESKTITGSDSRDGKHEWSISYGRDVISIEDNGNQVTVTGVKTGWAAVTHSYTAAYRDRHNRVHTYTASETYWIYVAPAASSNTPTDDTSGYELGWNQVQASSDDPHQAAAVLSNNASYGKVSVSYENASGTKTPIAMKTGTVAWSNVSKIIIEAQTGYKITGISLRCNDDQGTDCKTFKSHTDSMTTTYAAAMHSVTLTLSDLNSLLARHTENGKGQGSPYWLCVSIMTDDTQYTLSYEFTGDIPESVSAPTGGSYVGNASVTAASVSKPTGYTFVGWYDKSGSSDTAYCAEGASFNMPYRNLTLVGIWTKEPTYSVTYTWNLADSVSLSGGSTATKPTGDSYYEGEEVSIDTTYEEGSKITVQEGANTTNTYVFSGWSTTDATVADGKFAMPASNVTVTGTWELDNLDDENNTPTGGDGIPDKYQALVTYKVEGGTWDGTDIADKYAVFTLYNKDAETGVWSEVTPAPTLEGTIPDVSYAQPDTTHTTPAYWSPTPYAGDKVVDGAVYTYTFTVKGTALTFTFDANGGAWTSAVEGYTMGTNNTTAAKEYNFLDNVDIIGTEPTREGYEFIGWYAVKAEDGSLSAQWWAVEQMTHMIIENTTVYAKWQAVAAPEEPEEEVLQATLWVNLQDENGTWLGGTDSGIAVTTDYLVAADAGEGVDYAYPASVEYNGETYIYEGPVSYSAALSGNVEEDGQNIVVVLQYTIDELDDENNTPTGGDKIPDKYQALVTYKVEGGTWDGTDAKDKIEIFTLKTKDAKTGVWSDITPAPTLKGTIPDVSEAKPDVNHTIPAYWSPTPYESDKVVDGAVYTYTFTEKGEALTFTFDANGGAWTSDVDGYTMGTDNTTAAKGGYAFADEVKKIEDEPTRDGYEFVGWYTKNNQDVLTAQWWSIYNPTEYIFENTTVYAKWQAVAVPEEPEEEALKATLWVNLQDENGTWLGGTDNGIEVTSDYLVAAAEGDGVDYVYPASVEYNGETYIYEGPVSYSASLSGNIEKDGQNIVVVLQYTIDELNDKDNLPTGGDTIPDKYQVLVQYVAKDGKGTVTPAVQVETLLNDNGSVDTEITAKSEATPKSGYYFVKWTDESNAQVSTSAKLEKEITVEAGETYTFTASFETVYVPPYIPPYIPPKPQLNKEDHFAYIIGKDDGLVHPLDQITRAETATIFFRMLLEESREDFWTQENGYLDVELDDWFNNAVSTLSNAGIIYGRPGNLFAPYANISRAEFATLAVRFFLEDDVEITENNLTDVKGHWAEANINLAYALGLITGYPDNTFRPDQEITRAEAMVIVNRVLERHPDKDNLLDDMITWPDNMNPDAWYYADIQEATNSHTYVMMTDKYGEKYEVWQNLLEVRDWAALEKAWSEHNSSKNPGEVVDMNKK